MQPSLRCGHGHPKSFIIAIAAHVEDGAPRPPELEWYQFNEWGGPYPGGWMDWPAAEFARARVARNVYMALSGWRDTKNAVEWANANPTAWELVTYVMTLKDEQREAQHG